jgi:hypothetical protein
MQIITEVDANGLKFTEVDANERVILLLLRNGVVYRSRRDNLQESMRLEQKTTDTAFEAVEYQSASSQ